MIGKEAIKKVPGWIWKVFAGIGTVAGVILSVNQLSDYYWEKAEKLVRGSVTQATLKVTTELRKSEQSIGGFIVDDIKFRIIVVQDTIAEYERNDQKSPAYLKRQLDFLKDELSEAKEKWEK